MPSTDSQLQVALADALHQLEERLRAFVDLLRAERRYAAWAWRIGEGRKARDAAIGMFLATDYLDSQEPNSTRILPALLCATEASLAAATALNQAKAEFDVAYQALSKRRVTVRNPQTGMREELTLARLALREMDRGRLHYRQTTRRILLTRTRPISVRFSWSTASTRVRRTSREDVLAELRDRAEHGAGPWLLRDIECIEALPREEPLALVKKPHPHPRVYFFETDSVTGERRQSSPQPASQPVLVPGNEGDPLPDYTPLPDEPPSKTIRRPRRKGTRIDPEPLLHTMPVHRYIEIAGDEA